MTEYEKSQLGLPHIFDESMSRMYYEAAKLSDEYNRTFYDDKEKSSLLLSQLYCFKDFLFLIFSLIRVRKLVWEDITQEKV